MSIQLRENPYPGVNAHLHSMLQQERRWQNLHLMHIVHLANVLAQNVVPRGYVINLENSVQIRRERDFAVHTYRADLWVGEPSDRSPSPSIAMVQEKPLQSVVLERPHVEKLALLDLFDAPISDVPYRALAIQRPEDVQPILWVEFLSPTNKGKTVDARQYLSKREDLLAAGINFVEIDYLNETPPTFPHFADYTLDPNHARPYRILVMEPHPSFAEGVAQVAEFGVGQPIPTLSLPLANDERIDFDFGLAYRKTFEEGLLGYSLDYEQLPLGYVHYSTADQAAIQAVMAKAGKAGKSSDE
ncbi:MAG: DUF4058 family protein [Phototrophicaceae bacterium]